MNPILLTCALLACVATVSSTVAIAIPTVVVTADLATTLGALGLLKLKTAAILAATRQRREAEENSRVRRTVALAVPAITGITLSTVTIPATTTTAIAALGLLKLKTAALIAATRSKRSADEVKTQTDNDIVFLHQQIQVPQVPLFETISQLEYEKCARRFLCEVASGQLEAPEYLQSVQVLKSESLEALVGSPELPYSASAKYGAKAKSIAKCQNKFTCPKTGQEILVLLGLQGA